MKFALHALLLLALALFGVFAVAVEKPLQAVIVSYPKDTPTSMLDEAKKAIEEAGGVITHEYNLIKGFAAKAPVKILETIQTLGKEHSVLIEQDSPVGINNS